MSSENEANKTPQEQETFEFLEAQEAPLREDFLQDVIKELAKQRRLKGLTQKVVNGRLGLADRLLNKYECGIKTPGCFTLYCWADLLDCDLQIVPRSQNGEQE